MKGMVGQIEQLIYPLPVIVDLLTLITIFILVAIRESENPRSTGMQPVSRLFFRVTRDQTRCNCLCGADMIRRIGSV